MCLLLNEPPNTFHTISIMASNNIEVRKEKEKEYRDKSRANIGRPPSFKLEFAGDILVKEELKSKISLVKESMRQYSQLSTNTDVLRRLLDSFLSDHGCNGVSNESRDHQPHQVNSSHAPTSPNTTDEPIFLTTVTCVENLANCVADHVRQCPDAVFKAEEKYRRGHAAAVDFTCDCSAKLSPWTSSPYVNNKFLVNYRIAHGYHMSGILPNQYRRFCQAADIGVMSEEYMSENVSRKYQEAVEEIYNDSCRSALLEEEGMAVLESEVYSGISIITDARHGWRKNSRQTDVPCIGQRTHKVLCNQIVTKEDDPVSQRHERLGTERIYQWLENSEEGPVQVAFHAHDRNLSISKYVREKQPLTVNQCDTWHAGKSVEKEVGKVTKGTIAKHGITWHRQLSDKCASIRTHVHWSIRNCQHNEQILRDNIDNIINHYSNVHTHCSEGSRCKMDENYEPSKQILTDPVAKALLGNSLRKTAVYLHPKDYIHAMDTYYVESFNNVLNVFQDKRISFGHNEYKKRSQLSVLHWNENVDRDFTSTWTPRQILLNPRQNKGKKKYKKCSFIYWDNVWNNFMEKINN